jgi:hypothetical protein
MKKNLLILILMLLPAACIYAQKSRMDSSTKALRYGGFINLLSAYHNPDFARFTDIGYCCPVNFTTGTVQSPLLLGFNGFDFGGLFELPTSLLEDKVSLQLRAGFSVQSATFSQIHNTVFNNPDNNAIIPGSFDYSIRTELSALHLDILPLFRPQRSLSLFAGISTNVIAASSFQQKEQIISPADFVFVSNGLSIRNEASGPIPGITTLGIRPVIGFSYEFPINSDGTLLLAPEALYSFGFYSVSDQLRLGSWKYHTLQAGLSVRIATNPTIPAGMICQPCYEFNHEKQDCLPEKNCDPKTEIMRMNDITGMCECESIEERARIDSIIAYFEDGSTKPYPGFLVEVEHFNRDIFRPLIPAIFFNENSRVINDAFYTMMDARTVQNYRPDYNKMMNDPMKAQADILNIIGYRMQQKKSATLILNGCSDGVEGLRETIGKDRALEIKRYLVNIWNIDENRITLQGRKLPSIPSPLSGINAAQENRRVECSSNDPEILAALPLNNTVREIKPAQVRYYLSAKARSSAPTGGLFTLFQSASSTEGQTKIFEKDFGMPLPGFIEINWKKAPLAKLPATQQDIDYELIVSTADKDALPVESPNKVLKVKQITVAEKAAATVPDKSYSVYDIPVTDPALLPTEQQNYIQKIIAGLGKNSRVSCTVYTNEGLDNAAVIAAAKRIIGQFPAAQSIEITSQKGSDLYKASDRPEAKILQRIIRFTVQNQIRK